MSNQYTGIDTNKSLVPINPEAFSEGLTYQQGRSTPLLYAAKNVLPTDLGYMSYFGTANSLGTTLLDKDIQEILSYRTLTGDTILFALCRDGCYFKALAGEGTPTLTDIDAVVGPPAVPAKIKVDLDSDEFASWTFLFNSPQGSTSPWHLWTYAVIENKLYLYQKGMKYIARIDSTEKGQFFVDKLLPSFIISDVARIYKYVAELTIKGVSAFTKRTVTAFGVDINVATTTTSQSSIAHNTLVAKLNAGGMGASLQNYSGASQNSLSLLLGLSNYKLARNTTEEEYYKGVLLQQDGATPVWAGALTLTLRGTAINIAPIANGDSWTVAEYVADTINAAGLSGVVAFPRYGAMGAAGLPQILIYVAEIAGDASYSLTQAGGNVPTWNIPTLNVQSFKFNPSAYKVKLELYVDPIAGPYTAGTVFAYSDINVSISVTSVTGDTSDSIQFKLHKAFKDAGYIVDDYYWAIHLPDNMALDFSVASYPAATSTNLYISFYVPEMTRVIEKAPTAAQLNITSTGTMVKDRHLIGIISHPPSLGDAASTTRKNTIILPSTGGTLIFSIRDATAMEYGEYFATGGEYFTYALPAWTTLAEAYAAYNNLVTFIDSIGGITASLIATPTASNPAGDLTISLWYMGAPARFYGYTISCILDGVELSTDIHGTSIDPDEYYGDLPSYDCVLKFSNADAIAYGTAMGITINGQSASWTWNIGGSNLTTIQNALDTMMPLYIGMTGNTESDGIVTINARFSPINTAIGISTTIVNGHLIDGFVNLATFDETTIAYTPYFEEYFIQIPPNQATHTITLQIGAASQVVTVYATDAMDNIRNKLVAAMDILDEHHYRMLQFSDPAPAYYGQITFSIISLDGSDPLVSVGPTSEDEPFTIISSTNETIELAQVEGISEARGRLLAWDYTNSFYLGSARDPADFTPSLSTQANSYRIDAVKGNVVKILPISEGSLIYSTGGIVKGSYVGGSSQQVFRYTAIDERGSIDPRHIAKGAGQQFFIGSNGLYSIDAQNNQVQLVGKELADYLNQYKYPLHVQVIGDRYLVINLIEKSETIDMEAVREGTATEFQSGAAVPGYTANPVQNLVLPDVAFGQNLFPIFQRALIYDIVLQKWGQLTIPYRSLFSINPFNQEGYPAEKDYGLRESRYHTDVRSLGAILANGTTVLFDDEPESSWLVYGKYKMSNSNFTGVIEVEADFVDYPNCQLQLEPSMDGRTIQAARIKSSAVLNKPHARWPILSVARWFNVVVKGKFNIIKLGVLGKLSGRRP